MQNATKQTKRKCAGKGEESANLEEYYETIKINNKEK